MKKEKKVKDIDIFSGTEKVSGSRSEQNILILKNFMYNLKISMQKLSNNCNRRFSCSVLAAIMLFSVIPAFSERYLLADKAAQSGMTLYWDTLSSSGIIEKNGHQISFQAESSLCLLDSSALIITDAPVVEDGKVFVTENFVSSAEEYFKSSTDADGFKIGAILIDPGHGGKDPGASGTVKVNGKTVKVQEKDVVLKIGKSLYSKLKSAYPDKQIIMTRYGDTYPKLSERTDIANSVKLAPKEAILYVSIHANASLNKASSGYEVWYLSPGYRRTVLDKSAAEGDNSLFPILNSMMEEEYTTESILMSKFIMDGLSAQIGSQSKARGIKAEEWFVVRNANMPSVLIEVGFVTNEKEALNLNSDAYLQKIALGIYNGISAFVTHFERSRGFISTK